MWHKKNTLVINTMKLFWTITKWSIPMTFLTNPLYCIIKTDSVSFDVDNNPTMTSGDTYE